jgi:hypothetical protein
MCLCILTGEPERHTAHGRPRLRVFLFSCPTPPAVCYFFALLTARAETTLRRQLYISAMNMLLKPSFEASLITTDCTTPDRVFAFPLLTQTSRVPIPTLRPALLKVFTWSSSVLARTLLQITPPVYPYPNTEATDSVIKQSTNTYRPTRRHAHFVTCPERLCRDWATMTSQVVLRCGLMVNLLFVAV